MFASSFYTMSKTYLALTNINIIQILFFLGGHQVTVDNFKQAMNPLTAPYLADQTIPHKPLSYKDSGVDIEAGDSLVSMIKPLAR